MARGRRAAARTSRPTVDLTVSGLPRRIEELRAEARYARERYDLYRAKTYGMRPTSAARLRELERIHRGADARLRRAEQENGAHPQTGSSSAEDGPASPDPRAAE